MVNQILSQNDITVNNSLEEKKDFGWIRWPKEKTDRTTELLHTNIENRANSARDVSIKIYRRDSVITHSLPARVSFLLPKKLTSKRKNITRYSKKSRNRLRHLLRNIPENFKMMITLTLAEIPVDGRMVQNFLECFRKRFKRKYTKTDLVWIKEFQRRGSPHFHLLVNNPFIDAEWVAKAWSDVVGSDNKWHCEKGSRVEYIRTSVDKYLAKYVGKEYQKIVPEDYENVGRFWGASRGILKPSELNFKDLDYSQITKLFRILKRYYQNKCKYWGWKYKYRSWTSFIFKEMNSFIENHWMPLFLKAQASS